MTLLAWSFFTQVSDYIMHSKCFNYNYGMYIHILTPIITSHVCIKLYTCNICGLHGLDVIKIFESSTIRKLDHYKLAMNNCFGNVIILNTKLWQMSKWKNINVATIKTVIEKNYLTFKLKRNISGLTKKW